MEQIILSVTLTKNCIVTFDYTSKPKTCTQSTANKLVLRPCVLYTHILKSKLPNPGMYLTLWLNERAWDSKRFQLTYFYILFYEASFWGFYHTEEKGD